MQQPRIRLQKIQLYADLIFFLVFFPLVITLVPVDRWLVYRPMFTIALTVYLLLLYVVYRRINIPRMMLHRKWIWGIMCIAAVLFCTWLFVKIFENPEEQLDALHRARNRMRVHSVWFLTLIVTGYSFSNNLLIELFKVSFSKQDIEAEKNKAELAMYKAQINPHFLFNTLNTLYGLFLIHSEKAAGAFERFINLIKYTYRNASRDFIPVSEETEYIRQYVELQSLRLNKCTKVSFHHDITSPGMAVPPMLFVTFAENAFKYGVASEGEAFIEICMRQKGDMLLFTAENSISVREHKDSGKTGIENCRRRLGLLYPDSHRISITDNGKTFRVEVEIDTGGRLTDNFEQ
ncbi:MAG: sensor histidine kinase [Prevotella sp.]